MRRKSRPPTDLSVATRNITGALREIATRYSFLYDEVEYRQYPQRGRKSERVDVAFLLRPGGDPVFWFEIDNNPARAATNLLKIFGHAHRLIPITTLAVHHGRVAKEPLAYPDVILKDSALPFRFLDSLSITTESYDSIRDQLSDWMEGVFAHLAVSPEWGTVFDVASQYQTLVTGGGLHLAAAHLEAQAELAWSLLRKGLVDIERAACLTITLARMLQRAGYHRRARKQMHLLRKRVPSSAFLSRGTADSALAVKSLLGWGNEDVFSPKQLSTALSSVTTTYHKSQFLWRSAIPHILSGGTARIEEVILNYQNLLSNSAAAQANVAFLRTLAAVKLGRGDPRELSENHVKLEHFLFEGLSGAPDGTIHGFVMALYLKVIAGISCGNRDAECLLPEIVTLCKRAGLPQSADGFREISYVLPRATIMPAREEAQPDVGLLWPQINRRLHGDLHALHAKVNYVCRSKE